MPPSPSISDIQIAQRACILAGLKPINAFDEPNNETAAALNAIYADITEDCLTIHPWRFANLQVDLGPPLSVEPAPLGYQTAYAIPEDPRPLRITTLLMNGTLANRYKVMGKQIWTMASGTEVVTLDATWSIPEADWPPWFRVYAIERLAAFLGGAVTRNGDLATFHAQEAEKQLARSRTRDSQQQTTTKLAYTKIRSARLGGRPT